MKKLMKWTMGPLIQFSLSIVLLGCGLLDDPSDPGDVLWNIEGKIENTEIQPVNMRAAIVWYEPNELEGEVFEGGAMAVAQDIALVPEFPSHFTLQMYEPPPDQVMFDARMVYPDYPDGMWMARGQLLIYEDLNLNGMIDFLDADSTSCIDRVIGPGQWYELFFVMGDYEWTVPDHPPLVPGLNIMTLSPESPVYLPPDTVLEVTLHESNLMQYDLCTNRVPHGDVIFLGEVDPEDLPVDVFPHCDEENIRHLDFFSFPFDCSRPCVQRDVEFGSSNIPEEDPIPEVWPCPFP